MLRVRIRQFLPEFEKKTGIDALKIANTMKRLQTSKSHIDKEVDKILKNNFSNHENEVFWCSKTEFLKLDNEMQFRILGRILKVIACSDYIPSADKLFFLIEKIKSDNFKASTLGHCYIFYFNNKIWFVPEKIENESYNKSSWDEYIKTNVKYKNKKIPGRVKRILCK